MQSLFFHRSGAHRDLHSFPTRRSSDLVTALAQFHDLLPTILEALGLGADSDAFAGRSLMPVIRGEVAQVREAIIDRKSTRLNSSHPSISYAVFCLKKKIQQHHCLRRVT